ncbi:11335_t:CDS:2, partial [Paraglomus occultum]
LQRQDSSMLSPVDEHSSPLHSNTASYANPFELDDATTTIEPDADDVNRPFGDTRTPPASRSSAPPPTRKVTGKASSSATVVDIETPPPIVSGSIGGRGLSSEGRRFVSDTLDEPVSETILRDLRNVALKLQQVLHPNAKRDVLRDWDLWGPLILCLSLAIMLSVTAPADQEVPMFTGTFVIVWCGAIIITINAKLLGGSISFFQSVCILGYCIFPLVIVALVSLFVKRIIIRLPFVILAFAWSSYASVNFLTTSHLSNRRALAVRRYVVLAKQLQN